MPDAANRFIFTLAQLRQLQCPPSGRPDRGGRLYVYDARCPGLAFCVTEAGGRSYHLCYRARGSSKRHRLGDFDKLPLEMARQRAKELNGQIAVGGDPRAAELAKRGEATMGDLWQSYLDGHSRLRNKPRTVKENERLYRQHLQAWAPRGISEIAPRDIDLLMVRVGKTSPYTANRLHSLLRCMFRKRGHLLGMKRLDTPTAGIERYREQARERVLSDEELASVLGAIQADENEAIRDFFPTLFFTGARRGNVAAMRWEDLNLDRRTWRIPGECTKNGSPLVVQLAPVVVEILRRRPDDSPYVFPAKRVTCDQAERIKVLRAGGASPREIAAAVGVSQSAVCRAMQPGFIAGEHAPITGVDNAWERVLKRAGIDPKKTRTTIHDLRRTFCTRLAEAGVTLPYLSAALGHKSSATTQKHYTVAREDKVRESVEIGVASILAAVAKVAADRKAQNRQAAG